MRILNVLSTTDPRSGGPIEVVKQFSGPAAEDGAQFEVLSLDMPNSPWIVDLPFRVYPVGTTSTNYRYSSRLVHWLREHAIEYDHVLVHGIWEYSGYGSWRALSKLCVPYSVFTHGMLDPWFKERFPLKHIKKSLYWRPAVFPLLRDAQSVIFTCQDERDLARESFRPYRCNEAVVSLGVVSQSGNPQELEAEFRKRHNIPTGVKVLLFLGRLHPKKGCDYLLTAFATAVGSRDSYHLVMAGPDQIGWQADLIKLAERLEISHKVTWTGMLSGSLKWGAIHAAEALVLPSHQENFGLVVAEALSCGTPVLITNKVNIWREIHEDCAGLISSDTLESIREMIDKWIHLPDAEKSIFRSKAKACFANRFEIYQATRHLLNTIRSEGCKLP